MNAKSKQTWFRISLLVTALFLGVLYQFIPYGRQILYPFTLLFTWVHEMGHGITALLCGGRFEELKIFSNAAGVALISAPSSLSLAIVDAGGLLAPPFIGMITLCVARSFSRVFLWILSLLMAISLFFWVRSFTGLILVGGLGTILFFVAMYAKAAARILSTQFLGLVLVLFTIVRMDYLFVEVARGAESDGPSDIADLAKQLGGPYQLWGVCLAGLSLAFLVLGLYFSWRRKGKVESDK